VEDAKLHSAPTGKPGLHVVAAALERPLLTACIVGLLYLSLCSAYIVLSSSWASSVAGDVDTMRRLEMLKGLLFCLGSGAFLGLVVLVLLRMVASRDRELERERGAALKAERRAAASVSLASLAHDLNNLVGMARSLLGSVPQDAVQEEYRQRMQQIQRLLMEIVEMNRKVIDSSRMRETSSALKFDVAAEVGQAVSLASSHGSLRGCEVRMDVEAGVSMVGDRTLLHQAVVNLLLNASEAAPHSTLLVRVARRGQNAIVEMHDSGPGIPEDELKLVFKPFYTAKAEGTGLGLVAVQGFAELHRGAVEITDSELGGACIRLKLPAQ